MVDKQNEEPEKLVLYLPAGMKDALRNAAKSRGLGERGMSEEVRRRLEASFFTDTLDVPSQHLGKLIAKDADSYRYLAESIRMHPDAATLKALMKTAGFGHVDVHPLAGGIVALHVGIRC